MLATVEDLTGLPSVGKKMNGHYVKRVRKLPVRLQVRSMPDSQLMYVSLFYYQESHHLGLSVFRCWLGEFPKASTPEYREDREILTSMVDPADLKGVVDLNLSRQLEAEIVNIYEIWSHDGTQVKFEFKFEGGGVYTTSINDTGDFFRWLYSPFLG